MESESSFVENNLKLGARVSVGDFIRSETADKKKMDNRLPKRLLENARLIVALVARCEALLGCRFELLAGYRTPALSVVVGGKKNSFHTFALAVDGRFKGMSGEIAGARLSRSGFQFAEIEIKPTSLHLAYDASGVVKLFRQHHAGGAVVRVQSFSDDGFQAGA